MPDNKLSASSPSASPRALNTKRGSKPIDIGKAIGQFDTATVREKVRKWQTTGGGVFTTSDGGSEKAAETSESQDDGGVSGAKSHIRSKSVGAEVIEPPEAPGSPFGPTQEATIEPSRPSIVERRPHGGRLEKDLHQATAPKKRIVSDGHWVKRKPPPKEEKEKPPQPPNPQLAWIRPTVLPRPKQEPPLSPKPPREIKVYVPRPRKQSFHSSSEDAKPILVRTVEPFFRTAAANRPDRRRTSNNRQPATKDYPPTSEEDVTPRQSRPYRLRKIDSPYDSAPNASPKMRNNARPSSLERPSSPETAHDQRRRQRRRRSTEDFWNDDQQDIRRHGSIQKTPEMARDYEFSRPNQTARHRSKSVGRPLETHKRYHSDLEERYVQSGRRKASYQEEFAKYAPQDRGFDSRQRSTRKRSPSICEEKAPEEGLPEAPRLFGSRVEAWLQGTPDPFDGPTTKSRKSMKPSKRAFSFESHSSGVDFGYSSAEKTSHNSERQTRSRTHSRQNGLSKDSPTLNLESKNTEATSITTDPEIEAEYSSTTSVPSLKRSGARRGAPSPTKERATSPSVAASVVESEVASSAISSSVDASAFLPPDAPARHSALGIPNRRLFQMTSKRLSTIASVETFNTKAQQAPPTFVSAAPDTEEEPKTDKKDAEIRSKEINPSVVSAAKSRVSLKRRLTTHADLISVLSMPESKSKSIVSARSIRTHRSRLATATIGDLMTELSTDELKYMRELRTLADGVILVLLKCALSKSDAALAAGLYSRAPTPDDIANATKLIRELGVALTRLKTLHNRIPKEDPDAFLNWAQSAQRIYKDYVKTWRLGFEDVVVNLATDDGTSSTASSARTVKGGAWDDGLPRNDEGYVVDGNGERVDVAFLLKRPLVRLKYLSKTVKGINIIKPSEKAAKLATEFEELMSDARKRVNEEKARVEDESAAAIDATRARDPQSLGPLSGAKIDSSRCVRARDYFDMGLIHSSGQIVNCRIEILLRDDPPGKGAHGDVLICEVDNSGRWLFFPPILLNRVSARRGDAQGEFVVMIRGMSSRGKEWYELLMLQTADDDIASEWVELLGSDPIPPSLSRSPSFTQSTVSGVSSSQGSSLLSVSEKTESTLSVKSTTPSPRAVQIPIGERASEGAKRWANETPERPTKGSKASEVSPITPPSEERPGMGERRKSTEKHQWPWSQGRAETGPKSNTHRRDGTKDDCLTKENNRTGLGSPGLKRSKAARYRSGRDVHSAPHSPVEDSSADSQRTTNLSTDAANLSTARKTQKPPEMKGFSVWLPPSETESDFGSDEDDEHSEAIAVSSAIPTRAQRHSSHGRASSLPTEHLKSFSKLHQESYPSTPLPAPQEPRNSAYSRTPTKSDVPASASPGLRKTDGNGSHKGSQIENPPAPPPHRTPSSAIKSSSPQLTPTPQLKRRSSSPLKHEYQPSSASEASEISDLSATEEEYSEPSESEDDELEDDDLLSSLAPSVPPHQSKPPPAPETIYSIPNGSLKPSDSASQAPYRKVPEQPQKSAQTVATVMYWSDRADWEKLHPEECSIVISPGLVAAYELNPAPSSSKRRGVEVSRPLIALELTPLVPLRRGTALDISIRSPPTPASRLKPGSNIMLRSRSPEDCEALYSLINAARINNPTYIALQNARPPQGDSSWAAVMDRQNRDRSANGSKDSSWWHFGSSSRSRSYRAGAKAASRSGATESSIGTISSVMSAMKRFSGSGRFFSRSSGGDDSTGSSGSLGGGDGAHSPPTFVDPAKAGASIPADLGLANAKIRLYVRQAKGKWQDLGASRLSVLQRRDAETASEAGVGVPVALQTGAEKRILVTSKNGDVLLDATLGESCFERVARTGIAVSVWEDVRQDGGTGVAATGGVGAKTIRYYMIQLKSERECAYTFSLLGRLRY